MFGCIFEWSESNLREGTGWNKRSVSKFYAKNWLCRRKSFMLRIIKDRFTWLERRPRRALCVQMGVILSWLDSQSWLLLVSEAHNHPAYCDQERAFSISQLRLRSTQYWATGEFCDTYRMSVVKVNPAQCRVNWKTKRLLQKSHLEKGSSGGLKEMTRRNDGKSLVLISCEGKCWQKGKG